MTYRNQKFFEIFLLTVLIGLLYTNQAFAGQNNTNTDLEKNLIPAAQKSITVIKNQSLLSSKYFIVPGDVISISVHDEQEFTQPSIIVRPDGYATINPIGEIYIAGYDIKTLTSILKNKLGYYLREPQISVNIIEFHPPSIYVYGAVQKPGMYQQVIQTNKGAADAKNPTVRTDLTVSNILANAGGITYDADLKHVQITNNFTDEKKELDLWRLINEGDTSQNIVLQSGDTVFVPKLENIPPNDEAFKTLITSSMYPEVFPVRVIGEVNRAGVMDLPTNTPYLQSAVAMAAGYSVDADQQTVLVYRQNFDGKISKLVVNPKKVNFMLRPNDLVEVKGRKMLKAVRIADYIARLLNPAVVSANTYNSWAEVFKPNRRYSWD